MHPLNVIKVSKEERGWDFSTSEGIGTNCGTGDVIWFFYNDSGILNLFKVESYSIFLVKNWALERL